MSDSADAFKPRWLRLLVFLIGLSIAYGTAQTVTLLVVDAAPVAALVVGMMLGLGLLAVYPLLTRWLEGRRHPAELDRGRALGGVGIGALIGLMFMAVTIGVIALIGGMRVLDGGSLTGALGGLGFWIVVGVGEELLFRGGLFRILEEWTGTWIALVLSGVVFGAIHLTNPDASAWGALAIALEAGGLLGAAYVATRSLWLPIGIHIAWNFTQGSLFGAQVSGSGIGGMELMRTELTGADLLTGGTFGPEASVVAVLLGLGITAALIVVAHRRGNWIPRPRADRG